MNYQSQYLISTIRNNSNAHLTKSSYAASNYYYASHVHNYELLLIPPTNTYSYINNSGVEQSTCNHRALVPIQMQERSMRTCIFDDATINFVNTSINQQITFDRGRRGYLYYHLDVRVTDPDNQWTPNASVQVIENSFWSLGNYSTGSDGGLVRFNAKIFQCNRQSNYTYTLRFK